MTGRQRILLLLILTGPAALSPAVAQETMRLKPVAPFLWIEPTEDIVIGDVHVPKGNAVNVLTGHVATAADNFSEPGPPNLRSSKYAANVIGVLPQKQQYAGLSVSGTLSHSGKGLRWVTQP